MKTLFYTLLLSITTLYQLKAQELENSLLWEISGNKLEKPSYLYGTIHLICDSSLNENVQKH